MNKTIIVYLVIACIGSFSIGTMFGINNADSELENKVEFSENMLATKNLEYEWLSEITNHLIYGNNSNFQEQLDEIKEFREKYPRT